MEIWSPIPGFCNYSVSTSGMVRNDHTERIMKPFKTGGGHACVGLVRDGKQHNRMVARLVCEAFVPNHRSEQFDTPIHLDGDLFNCEIANLTWRPRWFAIKHTRQFRVNQGYLDRPVQEIWTGEVFANAWEAVKKYGLLYNEVVLSASGVSIYVFPTKQNFRWC
jgi:NUMOD4 motif